MNTRKRLSQYYIFFDYLAAALAWLIFFSYRKLNELDSSLDLGGALRSDIRLYEGVLIIPLYWILIYTIFGYYRQPYFKSFAKDLSQSFLQVLLGSLGIFFIAILDDHVREYSQYYHYFLFLFLVHLSLTLSGRYILRRRNRYHIALGRVRFPTYILGTGDCLLAAIKLIQLQRRHNGRDLIGYFSPNELSHVEIPYLGCPQKVATHLNAHTDSIILAFNDNDLEQIRQIMIDLIPFDTNVERCELHASPQGMVARLEPLLSKMHFPAWQALIKRIFDILFSILMAVITSPLLIVAAIGVRLSSPGPIFYRQERIGYRGKPFQILKFRSMVVNAEPSTPLLASEHDQRITSFGHFMRHYRIDELPQLLNVIRGDMALVGPRPERAYFIEQITRIAPEYFLLLRVKPGVTSAGEVLFGYAASVEAMIERMKFDFEYLNNVSILNDLKTLFYTVFTVMKGEGR